MLKAISKAWSWNFSLQERDGTPVADVLHSSSEQRYDITLRDGSRYTIRRRGIGAPFLLEAAYGSEIASRMRRVPKGIRGCAWRTAIHAQGYFVDAPRVRSVR